MEFAWLRSTKWCLSAAGWRTLPAIKDPKQNGGRSLQQLFDHVADDEPGRLGMESRRGPYFPPLSRPDTVAQMKIWIDGGAASGLKTFYASPS